MWKLLAIAFRNVLRNRRRTLITLAALVVGITAVAGIRGVLNGLQAAMVSGTINGQLGALQVHRAGYVANVLSAPLAMDFALDEALLAKVRAVPGVKAIAPRIQFAGSMSVATQGEEEPGEALFFAATAVDPAREAEVCPERPRVFTEGTRLDGEHLVLGDALARAFGAPRGAEVVLLAPDRDGSLNGELAKLGGSMLALMPGEMKIAIVPLGVAQKLLRMEGRATELAIAVTPRADLPAVAAGLRAALGQEYEVHAWDELIPERKSIMEKQTGLSVIVSFVFLLLMLLGVANTMLMSVLERTREVGTMLAVGLTRRTVVALFLLEALALGVLGGVAGVVSAVALVAALAARGLAFKPPEATLAIDITPFLTAPYLAGVFLTAVLGAVAFGLYPAWRASRLRPVEALAGH